MANSTGVLERWKEYFTKLFNVHEESEQRSECQNIHMAEPWVPEPTVDEVEIAVRKLKNYKAPGTDAIPAERIKSGGREIVDRIHKLILSVWHNETMPAKWRESIVVPIFKKGDKTDCNNFRGI